MRNLGRKSGHAEVSGFIISAFNRPECRRVALSPALANFQNLCPKLPPLDTKLREKDARCQAQRPSLDPVLNSQRFMACSGFRVQGSGFRVQGSGFMFRIVFLLVFGLKKLSLTCKMVHMTNLLCRI